MAPVVPLTAQLLRRSAALRRIRSRIDGVVRAHGPICFPHLVILSDTDYRTVLLFLDAALRAGELACRFDGLIDTTESATHNAQPGDSCSSCSEAARVVTSAEIDATFRRLFSTMSIPPSLFYGQRGITCESVLRRTAYMEWRGDLTGRRIVLLGDNDYQSIAIGLTQSADRIVVIDIDIRVLDNIRAACQRHRLQVETRHFDLYSGLPHDLRGTFDVFVFDPYPSPDASFETMVLRCGLHALRDGPGAVGYTFVSPTHKTVGYFLPLQRILTHLDLVMTDLVPRLAEFVPVAGELLDDERRLLARFVPDDGSGHEVVSHTKTLLRFQTMERYSQSDGQSGSTLAATDLGWRENLIRVMGRHYLINAIGFESQKQLVLSSVPDRHAWESAFSNLHKPSIGDFMPVGNLMTELAGVPISDDDCIRILTDDSADAQSLAARNGYVLTALDGKVLRTMALNGYAGMISEGLADDGPARQLYLLARVFASYLRQQY